MSIVTTIDELEAIYGFPGETSTAKVADRVTPSYRALIERSATLAVEVSPGNP